MTTTTKHTCLNPNSTPTGLFCVACVEEREDTTTKPTVKDDHRWWFCQIGDHEKCAHRIELKSRFTVCGCECHQTASSQPAPNTSEWRVFEHYPKRILDQTGVVVAEAQSEELARRIVAEHNSLPKLIAALEAIEAAFFEDAKSGAIVEKGKLIPLDNEQHPWIPGAKAWPVINTIRTALATLRAGE